MKDLIPFIQLGFAGLMALALLALVRVYMAALISQNSVMVASIQTGQIKIADSIDRHMGDIARTSGAQVELSREILAEAKEASQFSRDMSATILREAREEVFQQEKMRKEIRTGETPPST